MKTLLVAVAAAILVATTGAAAAATYTNMHAAPVTLPPLTFNQIVFRGLHASCYHPDSVGIAKSDAACRMYREGYRDYYVDGRDTLAKALALMTGEQIRSLVGMAYPEPVVSADYLTRRQLKDGSAYSSNPPSLALFQCRVVELMILSGVSVDSEAMLDAAWNATRAEDIPANAIVAESYCADIHAQWADYAAGRAAVVAAALGAL